MAQTNCAFCSISQGATESVEIVCAAADWLAFFPHEPATPGHTLVIPRTHIPDLWHMSPPLSSEVMTAAINVGRAIRDTVQPEGLNLITSAGTAAEQSVFHVHLHIVPRWTGDAFGTIWPRKQTMDPHSKRNIADRIRRACEDVQQRDPSPAEPHTTVDPW